MKSADNQKGFTLIELAIVLVIIGLIIGGVLVGQELIRTAEIRSQITQIEKYRTAVNTFRAKYNGIPGDLDVVSANQVGFNTGSCTGAVGSRNNDGLIDANVLPGIYGIAMGETNAFWQDLSSSNLIEGAFNANAGAAYSGCVRADTATIAVSNYIPAAKIGSQNYIYVMEYASANYFGIGYMPNPLIGVNNLPSGQASIPVMSAYSIDQKTDDGLPMSGSVFTQIMGGNWTHLYWAPYTGTSGGNATSCFDTTTGLYSTGYNKGSGTNCALSFRFQ